MRKAAVILAALLGVAVVGTGVGTAWAQQEEGLQGNLRYEDEPLSGVDAPSATRIEALFAELRAEGRALLVATHDARQARAWQRVLCLNRRQVTFGAPAEVLTPAVLQATYGGELVVLGDGSTAVAVEHHAH